MMLRQLYRLHGYHPVYALRSLAPLAIQVPFFIAAFGLLSHYPAFEGVGFLFLPDLARPDRLLGGVNLMPWLMTALNLYALHLYGRQLNRAAWAQGVLVALLFLFLLYDSPAGLVLYWSCNNLLSVLKSAWYTRQLSAQQSPHHLRDWLSELAACWQRGRSSRLLQAFGQQTGSSYALVYASLFLLLVVTLPIGFTSLEDNVDGLRGYGSFFLLCSGVAGLAYGLLCLLWYRLSNPLLRVWSTMLGLVLILLSLCFAFLHQPDAGMLDNFVFFTPAALRADGVKVGIDLLLLLSVSALGMWLVVRHLALVRNMLGILA